MDLARKPALTELMGGHPSNAAVSEQAGYATAIFMVGWALGGVLFGMISDRIGRTRTMIPSHSRTRRCFHLLAIYRNRCVVRTL